MFSLLFKLIQTLAAQLPILALACLVAFGAEANELSPESLVQRTIINHPRVRSAQEVVVSRDQSLAAAKLSRFPALSVDSSYTNLGLYPAIDHLLEAIKLHQTAAIDLL